MKKNLPRPRLVMVVKQKYKMNNTPNTVETNTVNQLMCVISVIHLPILAQYPNTSNNQQYRAYNRSKSSKRNWPQASAAVTSKLADHLKT